MDDASKTMTIGELQDLARRGKLRMRAFGSVTFFGTEAFYGGSLDKAADDLPRLLNTGLVAVYFDGDGVFLGPSNIDLVGDADPTSQSTRGRG